MPQNALSQYSVHDMFQTEHSSPFTVHRRAFLRASFYEIKMRISIDLKHNIGHRFQCT